MITGCTFTFASVSLSPVFAQFIRTPRLKFQFVNHMANCVDYECQRNTSSWISLKDDRWWVLFVIHSKGFESNVVHLTFQLETSIFDTKHILVITSETRKL